MPELNCSAQENKAGTDAVYRYSEVSRTDMDREKGNERGASASRSGEDYSEDDIDKKLKEFWAWLKRENIPAHGWITALSSIALLFVTFGQLVIAWENYHDTSPLVGYAKDTKDAAKDFASAAKDINAGVGLAVGELHRQATNT